MYHWLGRVWLSLMCCGFDTTHFMFESSLTFLERYRYKQKHLESKERGKVFIHRKSEWFSGYCIQKATDSGLEYDCKMAIMLQLGFPSHISLLL